MNNLQDEFLEGLIDNRVCVFLTNGVKLTGNLIKSDDECLTLTTSNGNIQLVYKHAISTVLPAFCGNSGNF